MVQSALQLDLERRRAELALYASDDEASHVSSGEWQTELRRLRGAQAPPTAGRASGKRGTARHRSRTPTNGDQAPR